MALTRKFLSALGIEAEKVDEIINAHTEVTDALKAERDQYKETAEKFPAVQAELASLKKAAEESGGKNPFEVKYNALKEDYEKYKQEVTEKEIKANKNSAYRAILKTAGISDKRIDAVLRVSDVDAVELDENGKIKDSDKLLETVKKEWADFISTEQEVGAPTPTPQPAPKVDYDNMSDAEYYKLTYEKKGN